MTTDAHMICGGLPKENILKQLLSASFNLSVNYQILLLLVICFFSFFMHLEVHDVDLMEARNFVTAREMLANGNWLLPTMNGETRINKPPLPTWVTALASKAFGPTDRNIVMRIPAAMAASLMVFSMWGFSRTLSGDRLLPFIAASILGTTLLVIDQGRRGTWDIYCHSFMLAAIWALSHARKKKGNAFGAYAVAGLALAGSFMSKGPVSFYTLFLPFCIAYLSAFGIRSIKLKWRGLLLTVMLFLILSSIWPVWMYLRYPVSIEIAKQELSAWSSQHVQPFYFYFQFPLYSGIWVAFIVTAFIRPYAKDKIDIFVKYRFVITWVILCLVFLSIVPEKKERYLLPEMIPMALMAGGLIRFLIQRGQENRFLLGDRLLIGIHTGILVIAALSGSIIVFHYGPADHPLASFSALLVAFIFMFTAMTIVYFYRKKSVAKLFVSSLFMVGLINLTILPIIYSSKIYRNNPELRSLREVQAIEEAKDLDCYYIDRINLKRVWDIGKPVRKWNYKSSILPTNASSFVIVSDFDPRQEIDAIYSDRIESNLLDEFRYDPKNFHHVKYLTLIRKLKE